jgi:hypothetical protein
MRALILGLVIVAVAAALLLHSQPGASSFQDMEVARLIYLLLWLLLVGAGVISLRRESLAAGGPGMLSSLLIWAAIFALIVLLYRAAWFWNGVRSLFS